MNTITKLRCINDRNVVGLTKGKLYLMLDTDGKYVKIKNDNGIDTHYKVRHFKKIIVE